jgi:hypothetical protein
MLESTETGRALMVALMKYAPSLTMKEAQKVFSEEVEDEELEQVLPMVKECVPEADDPELNTWEGFCAKMVRTRKRETAESLPDWERAEQKDHGIQGSGEKRA